MIGQTVTMTAQTYDMKSEIDTPNDRILKASKFPECRKNVLEANHQPAFGRREGNSSGIVRWHQPPNGSLFDSFPQSINDLRHFSPTSSDQPFNDESISRHEGSGCQSIFKTNRSDRESVFNADRSACESIFDAERAGH
jgi:hypothetical protein